MKITWLGHACFLLETDQGFKIVTDPYESGGYAGAVGYDPVAVEADLVTVSHQHADHNYIKPFKSALIIDREGSFTAANVKIESFLTYHDQVQGSLRGKNLIFRFILDSLKIVHFGDLGTEDIDYNQFRDTDIALIPVGGTFTLDAKAALRVLDRLQPKVAVPMHFKTDKLGFDIAGVDGFISGQSWQGSDSLEVNFENIKFFKPIVVLNYQR